MNEGYVITYVMLTMIFGLLSGWWFACLTDDRNRKRPWVALIPFGLWLLPAALKVYSTILVWAVAS